MKPHIAMMDEPAPAAVTGSKDILSRAAVAFTDGRRGYRDAMLTVGLLLHEYVLARLSEADGIDEGRRLADGLTRQASVESAADRLRVSPARVNELIAVSQVVALLGGGDPGRLNYSALRAFRPLVRRRAVPAGRVARATGRGKRPAAPGDFLPPSRRESWGVRGDPAAASALFRRAAEEGLDAAAVRALTSQPRPRLPDPAAGNKPPPPVNYREMARQAGPRDLAALILDMVASHPDPAAVARLVGDGLLAPAR